MHSWSERNELQLGRIIQNCDYKKNMPILIQIPVSNFKVLFIKRRNRKKCMDKNAHITKCCFFGRDICFKGAFSSKSG